MLVQTIKQYWCRSLSIFFFSFRNSSLLLASRLREEGDSFFFGDAMISFPPGGVHGEGKVGPNVEGEGEGLSELWRPWNQELVTKWLTDKVAYWAVLDNGLLKRQHFSFGSDYSQLDPLDASPFLLLNLELEVDYLISALANVMQTRANSFGHYFPPAGFQIQNFILQSKITRNVHWN